MTAKATYELHFGDDMGIVEFIYTAAKEWVAQVTIGDFSTLVRKESAGLFHPCCVHAERIYYFALGKKNSGRAA